MTEENLPFRSCWPRELVGRINEIEQRGWVISYDLETCFVGGTNPKGGRCSIFEVDRRIAQAPEFIYDIVVSGAKIEFCHESGVISCSTPHGLKTRIFRVCSNVLIDPILVGESLCRMLESLKGDFQDI
jgi:hypothetical protein